MSTILPNPSLITGPAKAADMIYISCFDIRGEEDFSWSRLNDDRFSARKAEDHRIEKSRYALDMEGFWLRDKCRIIAVSRSLAVPTLMSYYLQGGWLFDTRLCLSMNDSTTFLLLMAF